MLDASRSSHVHGRALVNPCPITEAEVHTPALIGNGGDVMKKVAILIAALCLSCGALAHSGGTDKNGCHRDHKNGGSHCH
ncbi:YHYH domain-containing protein [Variovorax boronicumulans]|uniref:YHYH domain-containing protein n=1 Tax=Variovorax boronicumulans TaxID=436515 RepID=UPI003522FB1D